VLAQEEARHQKLSKARGSRRVRVVGRVEVPVARLAADLPLFVVLRAWWWLEIRHVL
jgi:hypothetical protein